MYAYKCSLSEIRVVILTVPKVIMNVKRQPKRLVVTCSDTLFLNCLDKSFCLLGLRFYLSFLRGHLRAALVFIASNEKNSVSKL